MCPVTMQNRVFCVIHRISFWKIKHFFFFKLDVFGVEFCMASQAQHYFLNRIHIERNLFLLKLIF